MYVITGITGQVGGAVARGLVEAGQPVRAVVREAAKGEAWARRGCEVAVAPFEDPGALARAFEGAQAVFTMLPPVFDPSPGFEEARRVIIALRTALDAARPPRVVSLSTVGAQSRRPNLLTQHGLHETQLGTLPLAITFLRAAWFMENAARDVADARDEGVYRSFLQPLDRAIPMVATADIGRAAVELLRSRGPAPRFVELMSEAVSPDDIAAGLGRALGRDVHARAVPRGEWESLFRAQGMRHPTPRLQMLDGFNEGWIAFEGDAVRRGATRLDAVLRELVARQR